MRFGWLLGRELLLVVLILPTNAVSICQAYKRRLCITIRRTCSGVTGFFGRLPLCGGVDGLSDIVVDPVCEWIATCPASKKARGAQCKGSNEVQMSDNSEWRFRSLRPRLNRDFTCPSSNLIYMPWIIESSHVRRNILRETQLLRIDSIMAAPRSRILELMKVRLHS